MSEHDEIRQMLAALKGLPWDIEVSTWDVIITSNGRTIANIWTAFDDAMGTPLRDEAVEFGKFIAAAPELVGKLLDECDAIRQTSDYIRDKMREVEVESSHADIARRQAEAERDAAIARAERAEAVTRLVARVFGEIYKSRQEANGKRSEARLIPGREESFFSGKVQGLSEAEDILEKAMREAGFNVVSLWMAQ